jgi:acylphosphatase
MASSIEAVRLTARVSGRVQGVGYRFFARRQAQALGLRGYVRNLPGDGVEVVSEGARNLLEQLLDALRRGPAGAHVMHVEVAWDAATGDFDEFRIEH